MSAIEDIDLKQTDSAESAGAESAGAESAGAESAGAHPLHAYLPVMTRSIAIICCLAQVCGLAEWMMLQREGFQVWQIFTGQLVHWNSNHMAWDLITFVALGCLVERIDHKIFVLAVLLGGLASATGWWFLTDLSTYRGLSGIDSALFMAWIVLQWREVSMIGKYLLSCLVILALAKAGYEWISMQTLFANSQGYVPVPIAHLGGYLAGAIASLSAVKLWSRKC